MQPDLSACSSACAYGGAPKREQLRDIQSGASILIATPGRLNDFLDSNQIDLSQVFYVVLDEADRMLDMGFEPQIRQILKRVPRHHRQVWSLKARVTNCPTKTGQKFTALS